MKETLKPGIEAEFTIRISESKTVPALYPKDKFDSKMKKKINNRLT